MGGREDVNTLLKNFRRKLEKEIEISRIILFGSRARNEKHEFSDVDLIIVSPMFKGKDYFERATMMYDYWDSDLPVDFLCYTPEEFIELKNQTTIVRQAIETGIEA